MSEQKRQGNRRKRKGRHVKAKRWRGRKDGKTKKNRQWGAVKGKQERRRNDVRKSRHKNGTYIVKAKRDTLCPVKCESVS